MLISKFPRFSHKLSLALPENICATSKSHYITLGYNIIFKCEFGLGGDYTFKMPVYLRGRKGEGLLNKYSEYGIYCVKY